MNGVMAQSPAAAPLMRMSDATWSKVTRTGLLMLTLGISVGVLAAGAAAGSLARNAGAPTQLQVVDDTSASVSPGYRIAALRAIANVVERWPLPVPESGGSAPQSGLAVQVRGVSASSYAPENVLGTWTIDGIPGVAALPKTVTSDFTQRVLAYRAEYKAATHARAKAALQARRAAGGLRRLRPKTTYASEIEGAVSAAVQSFSPGGRHKLVVVSDLAQNRRPEIAGSLAGVEVLVAHLCREAARCRGQEADWGKRLRARGAVTVTFVRIERFPTAIASFLREK